MKLHKYLISPVLLLMGGLSFSVTSQAGTLRCTDAKGEWSYETYSQDGGPCCGHTSLKVSYKGQTLKDKDDQIYGSGGEGRHRDTNPTLTARQGKATVLGQIIVDNIVKTDLAFYLELTNSAGPVGPETKDSVVTVAVICREEHYKLPPP